MTHQYNGEQKEINCINCITGATEQLSFSNNRLTRSVQKEPNDETALFIAPGLIDLQINGVNGIDFNNPGLTEAEIVEATHFLLGQGVTTFLPTVITNSDENICRILQTIHRACEANPVVNDCVWGIHVEGPFISPAPGAKGAHDEKYIKAPDWALFRQFQHHAGGRIRLTTIAPEWEGAPAFIRQCRQNGVLVSIGHSMATTADISRAIKAGASLSTHLGNGVPLMLPRHPNLIWDQLAADELYSCIIADGIHTPDSFLRVVIKNKGERCLVVSDATCFAGMSPGEYENHIGGKVILDREKRVSMKGSPGILAGAAKTLLENVETLIAHGIATLGEAWQMASTNVAKMLSHHDKALFQQDEHNQDFVVFKMNGSEIQVVTVIKKGRIVAGIEELVSL